MPNVCECDGCTRLRGEMRSPQVCENCNDTFDRAWSIDAYLCDPCYEDMTCSECGNHRDDCFCCPDCDRYPCACDDDYYGHGHGGHMRGYSFTPELNFHEVADDPDADRLHFGFELEVPVSEIGEFTTVIYDGPGRQEELLYCKEDGSIDGVEIVTHPMTHKFFREQFPWYMFGPGSDLTHMIRETPREGYGLHVHVSRRGFVSEAHTLRWLLLIYRNTDWMNRLARRANNSWASFEDADHCVAKAKNTYPATTRQRAEYRDIYGRDPYTNMCYEGPRYSAVNANNPETFEVRLFRSTWTEQELRAAVDFCHASVKYTEKLTAGEALRGGLSWDSFREWVAVRPEYAYLDAELTKLAAA